MKDITKKNFPIFLLRLKDNSVNNSFIKSVENKFRDFAFKCEYSLTLVLFNLILAHLKADLHPLTIV